MAAWRIQRLVLLGLLVAGAAARAAEPFPAELTQFRPVDFNPVFTAGGPDTWEVKIRERGWILRDESGWRMWYTGYDGTREGRRKLGYATSPDGIKWTRHPENPLHEEHWIEDMCIVPHEGTLYMFAEGEQDRAHLLTSRDGVQWQRVGQLDVRLKNGEPIPEGPYGTPTVWFENGIWNLFYERGDRGIWLAQSKDLKTFVNVQDEPVLNPGPDEFDHDLIAMNQIVRYDGRYYAVIHGTKKKPVAEQPNLWSTGLAVSTDLIHWEKYPGNPLRPIEENKSSGLLFPDGLGFRLYTMHGKVDIHVSPRALLPVSRSEISPDRK